METGKTFVPENLYATTSGIAGRTIALTRWNVRNKENDKWEIRNEKIPRFTRDGIQWVHACGAWVWSCLHCGHWDDDLLQEIQVLCQQYVIMSSCHQYDMLSTICHLCTMSHTLLRSMGWQGNIYRVSLKKGTFLIFCLISVLEVGFYFFTCVSESEFWARFI